MFDSLHQQGAEGRPGPAAPLDAPAVEGWVRDVRTGTRPEDDASRIELIRALETLKNAAAAAQAEVTSAFDDSQRDRQAEAGVPARRRGRGVAHQVALARRESPHRGRQHLALASVLHEVPHAARAFRAGRITEWKVQLLLRETACLELEHRRAIDEELAADADRIESMGDRELAAAAAALAVRLDPASVTQRRRRAESERTVTIRPAPDTMTYVTGLLPVAQGVAVHAALVREADRLRAAGDERSRGQIMADTLVARVVSAEGATDRPPAPPVTVDLLVSDRVLLGGADQPAVIRGYGEIPGELARELVARNLAQGVRTSLRRVYATPETGALVGMDSRARTFPTLLGRLIELRDRTCRTPWCDAPVRHRDHVEAADEEGPTSFDNAQGLCEACNHAKQALGWQARSRPGRRHTVETSTPTGHRYTSVAPRAPTPADLSPAERVLADVVWVA